MYTVGFEGTAERIAIQFKGSFFFPGDWGGVEGDWRLETGDGSSRLSGVKRFAFWILATIRKSVVVGSKCL